MSRSYRKPWITDNSNPWAKREANKKVRRTTEIPDGKAYRKVYDPWNICDYKFLANKKHDGAVFDSWAYAKAIRK